MEFEIPKSLIGQDVELVENLPMQAPNGKLSYPIIKGKILEILQGAVWLQTAQGQMIIPVHILRGVNIASPIQIASNLVLPGIRMEK